MAEWSIAAVLKTVEGHTSGGSNPSLSAYKGFGSDGCRSLCDFFINFAARMDEKYDIFISYSTKDSSAVHEYARRLSALGYKVWYDTSELHGGEKFAKEIADAIESSKLFLFFSSENSNTSEWTIGEILFAKDCKKPIIPVRLDNSGYDNAVKLVLLPLHYVLCVESTDESAKRIAEAVAKIIGEPPGTEGGEIHEPRHPARRSACLWISAVSSVVMALGMMACSGEYHINLSLSLFTSTITAIVSFLCACSTIYFDRNWGNRPFQTNVAYIVCVLFFLSYSLTAFGLCYASVKVFAINSPSILFAALAIYALYRLMAFKKSGYLLLWISAALFAIGSYWWIGSLAAPFVLMAVAIACMSALRRILCIKQDGISHWERLA